MLNSKKDRLRRLMLRDSLDWRPQAFLLAALGIMLLPWLGDILFNSKGGPREAIVAVSILDSGNWVLPMSMGHDMPYKPPFLAWLTAVFAIVLNGGVVNEYISRLPSALAMMGMCWAVYRWAAHSRGARFGLLTAMLLATCFEVFRAGIASRVDMVLTACSVVAILVLARQLESPGRWRYLSAIVLLTCATLTKGPVGSLLPCLVIGVYWLARRCNFWSSLWRLTAVCLASFVIPACWYYAAWRQGGQPFLDLAYEENILRLTGHMSYESHLNPWWYNFMTLAAGLLPWTLIAVLAAFVIRRRHYIEARRRAGRGAISAAGILSIIAAVVIVVFYSIPASKRSVYLLPAYPFLVYGLAAIFMRVRHRWPAYVMAWLLSGLALAGPIALLIYGVVYHVDLSPLGYAALVAPMVAGAWWLLRRSRPVATSVVCAATLYMGYAAAAGPVVMNPRSDRPLAEQIEREKPTGHIYQLANDPAMRLYTINFYLHDRVLPVSAPPSGAPRGTILLCPAGVDTTGLAAAGWKTTLLTPRGCDLRKPVYISRKIKD